MSNQAIVTVYCLAYNHEKYIRQTLEGFVSQKTSFYFKVIVHDDASTDRTREIIEEYADRYPELFVPILQTENQYSKGVRIFNEIIEPLIDTEYIAVCEGDDYWTDPQKLQLQVDYMNMHPECSMCVHNTMRILEDGSPEGRNANPSSEDHDISVEAIIASGGGGLFHTSSFLYRRAIRSRMPSYFTIPGVGDYPISMYMAMQGTVHYIGRVMSAYRVNAANNWSQRTLKRKETRIKHRQCLIDALERIDAETAQKYHASFRSMIAKQKYQQYMEDYDLWQVLRDREVRAVFNQKPIFRRMLTVFKWLAVKARKAIHAIVGR